MKKATRSQKASPKTKPAWRVKIEGLIAGARNYYDDAHAQFAEDVASNGASDAISWCGEKVSRAVGRSRLFSAVEDVFKTADEMVWGGEQTAKEILKRIEALRESALDEAREGFHSACPFTNAVRSAWLEGLIRALQCKEVGGARMIQIIAKGGAIGG